MVKIGDSINLYCFPTTEKETFSFFYGVREQT